MEKAQALGARRSFAQLRRVLQPKLLWLCEGLSDPQHSPLPPCVCVRIACVRMRMRVRARARIL